MRGAIALLLAGSALFSLGKVKPDVVIDGVDVGGLPYAEAERRVREELSERLAPLVVHSPARTLVLSEELSVTDNAADLVRQAKAGERLSLSYTRNWESAERVLWDLCAENTKEAVDARLDFSASGFVYHPETKGVACDYHALLADVGRALPEGGDVFLKRFLVSPAVTEQTLRERTKELASASTCFDGGNLSRRHNIALAASRIAGTVLPPHGEFSFNERVGKRTEENGFRPAAVILNGEFVPGVGGGVCQASTTLYLAALRAGLSVTEARAHSLAVSYAPPSLDAMVSETSDLKFVNPYDTPVYLLSEMGKDSVTFRIFGLRDGRRYETESRILGYIEPPEPILAESGTRAEKRGIVSESYLVVYEGNERILRTRLRKDRYSPVRGIVSFDEAEAPQGEGDEPPSP